MNEHGNTAKDNTKGKFQWFTDAANGIWNGLVGVKNLIVLRGQESLSHIIPLVFCLLSLQNIQEYMYHLHPNLWLSWTAGIALGFGLLFQAWKLADMDWDTEDRGYLTVLATTVMFGLISGGIQSAAYSQFMHWFPAFLVGMSLPIVGELGIALSISAYAKAQREKRVANMQDDLGSEMRLQMMDAIKTMNRTALQNEVETGAVAFAKALIEATNESMIAELRKNQKGKTLQKHSNTSKFATIEQDSDSAQQQRLITANQELGNAESLEPNQIASSSEFGVVNLPAANEARTAKVQERQSAIMQLFRTYGQMKIEEVQKRLAEDCGIEASDRTLRIDLAKLIDDGELQQPSRGIWDVTAKIHFATEMILPEFSTNGKSH